MRCFSQNRYEWLTSISRYEPANRQTTADFLVAVTDPNARVPRTIGLVPAIQPRTAEEFAIFFRDSPAGKKNQNDLVEYEEMFVGNPDKKQEYIQRARGDFAKHAGRTR